jgi:hypothetical protein
VSLRNTKSSQKAPLSTALPSCLYHLPFCLERLGIPSNLEPVLDQILRPHLGRRPLAVITTYIAKETIGYTPAPSALPQSQLGTPCATLGTRHTNPCSSRALQSPRELYILALNKAASAHAPLSSKYSQGQRVWLEGKNLPISHGMIKLSPKRYGPFTITKLISPVAFQLDLPVSWNIHPVFHNNLLTPYVETNAHGPNFTRPPPDLINGEAEYEVEAIRSHRYFGKNKRLQYLLKWKGYPEANNTWELEDQLNVPDLLKQYNRCHNLNSIKARAALASTHSPPTSSL